MSYLYLCQNLGSRKKQGEDLYYHSIYDDLRQSLQVQNYQDLSKKTYDILITKSKDLQVLLWFCVAELHLKGMDSLTRILELLDAYLETCWANSYPLLNDDGLAKRQGQLELFFRTFFIWQNQQRLVDKDNIDITVGQWQLMLYENMHRSHSRNDSEASHELDLNKIAMADRHKRAQLLTEVIKALKKLAQTFASRRLIVPTFEKVCQLFDTWYSWLEENKEVPSPPPSEVEKVSKDSISLSEKGDETRTISDRASAYQALYEISSYLKSLDPHSLVPSLLELALKWENLTMTEILASLKETSTETKSMLRMLADATQKDNSDHAAK